MRTIIAGRATAERLRGEKEVSLNMTENNGRCPANGHFYSVTEAAELLNYSVVRVVELCRANKLRAIKSGPHRSSDWVILSLLPVGAEDDGTIDSPHKYRSIGQLDRYRELLNRIWGGCPTTCDYRKCALSKDCEALYLYLHESKRITTQCKNR